MILRVNSYITCKIGLKTRNPANSVKLGSTRSNSVNSDRVYEFDESYGPDFATHSPASPFLFVFVFCPNLTFSSLNLSTTSISNANLGLGFCSGCRQGGWERGRERKRGAPATLIRVWDFVWDIDRAGERGGGRGKGGFERRRISGWWKWKLWEE